MKNTKVYDVMLKHGSGWSSFDTIELTETQAETFTISDYIKMLAKDNDTAGIIEVSRADDFKIVTA